MKIQTVEILEEVLEPKIYYVQELEERVNILSEYPYSIIAEGLYNEFDSLDSWIAHHYEADTIKNIFYRKTGYDYGFAEYFTKEKSIEEKLRFIFTNSYFERRDFDWESESVKEHLVKDPAAFIQGIDWEALDIILEKTDGYEKNAECPPDDKDAIIYDEETCTYRYLSGQVLTK
jgi:hypothetical protein